MSRPRTIADACQSWLKTCERNELESGTLKAYRSHVRIHIDPKIGHLLVAELTRSDVKDFIDDMLDAGVSQTQVRKVMVSLRAVLAEAVDREWVDRNVASDVKLKRRSGRHDKDKVIPTKAEIRMILDRAPTSHRAMFVAAIFTGMRISELRGLTWAAVNFETRTIRVFQRADERCEIGPPKSRAGLRTIPMAPMLLNTLRAWKHSAPASDLDLVFPNGKGRVQNYANIYNRVFKPMLVDLDIVDEDGDARFGIHSLRHAAASLFIEQGWTPKKIQTLLGHASITLTMDTYGHLFENAEEDVAMFEKLESDLLAA
ncbi:tyrosine-type recombinase/integrase [Histidinibacterium aquaticum]|uniref:Site-specific integrase n=1 Tax=Histidinibacterium aquaticum TaxID=2613962 RepID=A0A5J5GR45_9RHOB|nr:site-specific integrase [Histidinibacterium aquaticum]KAA9010028.1 site-specific integrase [Histidinibacterium aquaticum]